MKYHLNFPKLINNRYVDSLRSTLFSLKLDTVVLYGIIVFFSVFVLIFQHNNL